MDRRNFGKSFMAALAGAVVAGRGDPVIAQVAQPRSFGPPGPPFASNRPVAFVGGTLIDATGAPPKPAHTVVTEGKRISRVGPAASVAIPEGAEVIDATGLTIMPGLINSNQHIQLNPLYPAPAADLPLDQIKARWEGNFAKMPQNAFVYLMQGVTTIRQTSGPWKRLLPIKQQIDRGELPGPRVMLGGALFMSGQHFDAYVQENQTPAETIPWLRDEFAYNVITDVERDTAAFESSDFAFWKLYMSDAIYDGRNDFSDKQIRWMIDRAHKLGKTVDVHTGPHNAGMRRMLKFDVDTLEHPFYPNEIMADDVIEGYVKKGVFVASLLTVMVANAERTTDPHRLDEALYFMSMRPDEYRLLLQYRDKMLFNRSHPAQGGLPIYQGNVKPGEVGDSFGLSGPSYEKLLQRRETSRENMRRFVKAGAKLFLGMDTPTFLNFNQEDPTVGEFQAMIDMGLSPMDAVLAATRNGAEALGMLDRLGTIEPGKLADAIALDGDPLKNAAALKRVAYVVKDGVRFK
ncbi:MAG: amidohydrolase family protein [Novosphingobium sp.]